EELLLSSPPEVPALTPRSMEGRESLCPAANGSDIEKTTRVAARMRSRRGSMMTFSNRRGGAIFRSMPTSLSALVWPEEGEEPRPAPVRSEPRPYDGGDVPAETESTCPKRSVRRNPNSRAGRACSTMRHYPLYETDRTKPVRYMP